MSGAAAMDITAMARLDDLYGPVRVIDHADDAKVALAHSKDGGCPRDLLATRRLGFSRQRS